MQPLSDLLAAAATILTGEAPAEGPPMGVLRRLCYLDDVAAAAPHRAAFRFRRIFTIKADEAPGLIALGAEVNPDCIGVPDMPSGSVSGTGLTFRQAFESCVGEGVEYISQFATAEDPIETLSPDDALAGATPALHALWDRLRPHRRKPDAARMAFALAADLADGRPVRLPADLCFRRRPDERDIDVPWPLSTGCGAGRDPLEATLHGVL